MERPQKTQKLLRWWDHHHMIIIVVVITISSSSGGGADTSNSSCNFVKGSSSSGGGGIRLIVGFQPPMVISPTASCIRWCMQVFARELMWTCRSSRGSEPYRYITTCTIASSKVKIYLTSHSGSTVTVANGYLPTLCDMYEWQWWFVKSHL